MDRKGKSLQDILVSGNPWSNRKCGMDKCFICERENGSMEECMRESSLYRIKCMECKRGEKVSEYWGETGSNCYLRGDELNNRQEDNALWKQHGGESSRGE